MCGLGEREEKGEEPKKEGKGRETYNMW